MEGNDLQALDAFLSQPVTVGGMIRCFARLAVGAGVIQQAGGRILHEMRASLAAHSPQPDTGDSGSRISSFRFAG